MAKEQKVKYALMTDRLFAGVIDMSLLYLLAFPIVMYLFPDFFVYGAPLQEAVAKVMLQYPELEGNDEAIMNIIYEDHYDSITETIGDYAYKSALQTLFVGTFVIPFIWKKGSTPGKMFLGLKVVDSITLEKISLSQSIIRFISYLPSVGFLFFGLIWGGFHKRKRCWHDIFADTVVIYDPKRWYWVIIQKLRDKFAKKD